MPTTTVLRANTTAGLMSLAPRRLAPQFPLAFGGLAASFLRATHKDVSVRTLAQINARYGPRVGTVVNNHRAKLFLSGIADPATLEHASALIGEAEQPVASTTVDRGRPSASTTVTPVCCRLAPADSLRQIRPGTGVLIAGHLPPVRLRLRPWFSEAELNERATGGRVRKRTGPAAVRRIAGADDGAPRG